MAGGLFIGNIGSDITEQDLREAFIKFGSINSVKIARDRSGKSKGCGFVYFDDPSNNDAAIREMHEHTLKDREIRVMISQGPKPRRSSSSKRSRSHYSDDSDYSPPPRQRMTIEKAMDTIKYEFRHPGAVKLAEIEDIIDWALDARDDLRRRLRHCDYDDYSD